jgi:uncharacterized membrane protein YkoI
VQSAVAKAMDESNLKKIVKNKTALATIIALAVVAAVVGSTSMASVIAQANEYQWTSGWKSNYTHPMMEKPNIQGSANLGEVIKNFIQENRDVPFAEATTAAETELADTKIVKGQFGIVEGYLVYTFVGVDNANQQMYKLIIDAANREVLFKSEPIPMNQFGKHYSTGVSAELDLSAATGIAQEEIENDVIDMGMLRVQDDKPVYVFLVTDEEEETKYSVTIDANSGEVLDVSEDIAKSGGFHGKHHGWHGYGDGHKAWSDKDKERSDADSGTGSEA